jgi:mono/diheme cytochrome c family protein
MMRLGLIFSATLALATGALAADRVDVTRGAELAQRWCAECHAIGRDEKERLYAEVPTFSEILQLPSTTEVSLRAFLQTPHPKMPNIKLAPAEIDELVAYILDLKEKPR